MSESKEQQAVIQWARMQRGLYPCLKWLHSSLNGVRLRSVGARTKAKREGMTSGVWDLFLPYNNGEKNGLYIEMKIKYNKLTDNQKEFGEFVKENNFECHVCYSATEAILVIRRYLGIN